MKKRLWIVICQFRDGTWEICDFAPSQFAFTDYYSAHRTKRDIQKYLQNHGSKSWYKKRFKVVEFDEKS